MRQSTIATRAWWGNDYLGCFHDSSGSLYFLIAIDDRMAVAMDFDGTLDCPNGGGEGEGEGGRYDSGTGIGQGSGGGGSSGPGGPGGSGGGGSSGPGGPGGPNPTTPLPFDPENPGFKGPEIQEPPFKERPKLPITLDPLPWDPIPPVAIPPKEPEKPEMKKPCVDSINMEANPIAKMRISNDNQSYKSNTWGWVRNNGLKFHDGLDLLGDSGVTLVYAMYTGKIVRIVSQQPNRINTEDYPSSYKGDDNSAGNRITIESILFDGRVIRVSYWHLDIVDKNPYTHSLRIGDPIRAGQVIGVVGTTGNAYGGKPHLHLKTHIVGTDRNNHVNNPYYYLYTKFDSNGKIVRDC